MLWNTIWLALRSIRRNLLRSFLTILGIVIGVSAVITMSSAAAAEKAASAVDARMARVAVRIMCRLLGLGG